MGYNNDILLKIKHSCNITFNVDKDAQKAVEKYFNGKSLNLVQSKCAEDEYSVSIVDMEYVAFKLLLSDVVWQIREKCKVTSGSRFCYTVEFPETLSTKLEFAINYGNTEGDNVSLMNKYANGLVGESDNNDANYGWRGVMPAALANDTVLTNCNIERLVYQNYEIDMRDYNNGRVTLSCKYKPNWTVLSMMLDYFASYTNACALRKIDATDYNTVNTIREKFNKISEGFSSYADFKKLCNGLFRVTMDMNDEETYIEAFFSMIKPELFRIYCLLSQCAAHGGKHICVNYDTDESRWQVRGFETTGFGLNDVRNLDIVSCILKNTHFGNCNIMDCEVSNCDLEDCSLIGNCDVKNCNLTNCYCGTDTCIANSNVEVNNTMDGLVKHSFVGDDNSYTDNARFVASKNKNNRKV